MAVAPAKLTTKVLGVAGALFGPVADVGVTRVPCPAAFYPIVLGALIALTCLWGYFVFRVGIETAHVLRGVAPTGAAAVLWLATVLATGFGALGVGVAPAGAATPPPTVTVHHTAPALTHDHGIWPLGNVASIPLALMARQRRDRLTQDRTEVPDEEIDATIVQFRQGDPAALDTLRALVSDRSCGLIVIDESTEQPVRPGTDEPVVAMMLATDDGAALVAFARPGSALPIGVEGLDLIERAAVVLNHRGRCRFATTPVDALRALALRASFNDVIVYLGDGDDLDDEVRRRCVSVGPGPERVGDRLVVDGRSWRFTPTLATTSAAEIVPQLALKFAPESFDVRVRLLRAEPTVDGLVEPFTATVRRKCVEMVAYLAIHDREPVTGDRLRTRVLGREKDASLRTLSNTASAVRRSLGDDAEGPRLRPVTAAGLYQLRSVGCDVTEFHELVRCAREPNATDVVGTLRRALSLVEGEPLAAVLRGYEWFIPEGHLARLQRDGEWAALRLAAEARDIGDLDLAFWAIERGRLLDPYSEVLEAALHRVPRLREFGRDGRRSAQHESVRTG